MSKGFGPPPLLHIVQSALVVYKDLLGDVGNVPINLLYSTLEACSPEELANIEDETLFGVARRDLSPCTWKLWHKFCTSGLLARLCPLPQELPPLSTAPAPWTLTDSQNLIKVADYRKVYEQLLHHRDQRQKELGKKMRQARSALQEKKAARCIKVIDPPPRGTGRFGSQTPGRSMLATSQQPAVRHRLMKKLGVRSSSGAMKKIKPPKKFGSIRHKLFGPKKRQADKIRIEQLKEDNIFTARS